MTTRLNLITFASTFQTKTEEAIRSAHQELFEALDERYEIRIIFEEDLPEFLQEEINNELTVVFVATGGTEGMVVRHYAELPQPMNLLTDGKANSLAASLELSCWIRQQGGSCNILHGTMDRIVASLSVLEVRKRLGGLRIGVIGTPSDWLVASNVDYAEALNRWGVKFVDISLDLVGELYNEIQEDEEIKDEVKVFIEEAAGWREPKVPDITKAMRLYHALRQIALEAKLDALTLQCFSLIPTTGTTGCLALALLNDEGIVAGCEGDLQSIFTMLLAKNLTAEDAFMANPSFIDAEKDEVLFAHCTIGLRQVEKYIIRSHFESQSGVAIQGTLPEGEVTILKFGGKHLDQAFICDGEIIANESDEMKCRTQVRVHLLRPGAARDYFLSNSIGNHHIIIKGHHASLFQALLDSNSIQLR